MSVSYDQPNKLVSGGPRPARARAASAELQSLGVIEMTSVRQRWAKGSVLEVKAFGYVCEAQMLEQPEIAFFDPEDSSKVLFRVWVMIAAYSTGRWLKKGVRSVPDELERQVPRFKQDLISGALTIVEGETERSATFSECSGLECAAVWSAEQVEDRIRDVLEGQENVWVRVMAPKLDV